MVSHPLEIATHKALNDSRIFEIREIIGKNEWAEIKKTIGENKNSAVEKLTELTKKTHLEPEKCDLIKCLQTSIENDSSFVKTLIIQLDSFGPISQKFPNMEDFGKVIEGHNRNTAERFFYSKIKATKAKETDKKIALEAVLEIVKSLYDQQVEPLEIAFFVRKLDSLTQIVEVLKCQGNSRS